MVWLLLKPFSLLWCPEFCKGTCSKFVDFNEEIRSTLSQFLTNLSLITLSFPFPWKPTTNVKICKKVRKWSWALNHKVRTCSELKEGVSWHFWNQSRDVCCVETLKLIFKNSSSDQKQCLHHQKRLVSMKTDFKCKIWTFSCCGFRVQTANVICLTLWL